MQTPIQNQKNPIRIQNNKGKINMYDICSTQVGQIQFTLSLIKWLGLPIGMIILHFFPFSDTLLPYFNLTQTISWWAASLILTSLLIWIYSLMKAIQNNSN